MSLPIGDKPKRRKYVPPPPKDKQVDKIQHLPQVQREAILARYYELQRRRGEAVKLYMPMELQDRFHRSQARIRLMGGGNRGGKTLSGMMEIGYIVRNCHPHYDYPSKGKIYVVGRDEDHIADVLYPKLFQPGGGDGRFRRIRDAITGEWRAYLPWQDEARFAESEPMPPVIPPYLFARKPSWKNAGRGVVEQVRLKTGWVLNFYAGGSSPPQGSAPNYIHLDEEIRNEAWFAEVMARLTDFRGRMTWSATAEIGGDSLWQIHMMCQKDLEKAPEDRLFEEFTVTIADNSHIDARSKKEFADLLSYDPQKYASKVLGHYAVEAYRVYPHFDPRTHVVQPFTVPDDWCRYMLVDPGHVACSVLFAAVPPASDKQHGGHVYIYDELYLTNTNAVDFAVMVKEKVGPQVFEDFIIDWNGSRRTESGGMTIREQFAAALKSVRVECLRRGSDFLEGSNNLDGGLLRTKEWLMPYAADGTAKLLLFHGCARTLEWELQRYHYKRGPNGIITNKPDQNGIHACDSLRYGVMHGLSYVKPRHPAHRKRRGAAGYLDDKRKRKPKDGSVQLSTGIKG